MTKVLHLKLKYCYVEHITINIGNISSVTFDKTRTLSNGTYWELYFFVKKGTNYKLTWPLSVRREYNPPSREEITAEAKKIHKKVCKAIDKYYSYETDSYSDSS